MVDRMMLHPKHASVSLTVTTTLASGFVANTSYTRPGGDVVKGTRSVVGFDSSTT